MTIPVCLRNRLFLTVALALVFALSLTACGSGGGSSNTRQGGSLAHICTDPGADNTGAPIPCSYSSAPPAICTDSKANNIGQPLPCTYSYTGSRDSLLIPNNAAVAHAEGFTGKGVVVGMVDTALDFASMNYSPLNGKVLSYDTALTDFRFLEASDEQNPHVLLTSTTVAGRSVGGFYGGVAPEVQLRWFGVCTSTLTNCRYEQGKSENYVQTLLNYGDARLINASIGIKSTGSIRTDQNASQWQPLLAHDALIVGSAGNQSQKQPSLNWQVPHTNSEYYGHFIVAMALHANDPNATENLSNDPSYTLSRAGYSNACGVAAQWCVGAVSNIQRPDVNNPYQLSAGAGTSVAAPVVTGVAALVLEAYPWMSALNVQQTVLTTATDIGAPGVDDIYGWGLVNAAKAIHGPAQFVKNRFIDGFTADFDGGSRPFSNAISGAGWLIKRGSGTLTLTGNNSYTGGTTVEEGTLRSSGSFGSKVEVAPGATFMTAGAGATINGHYTVISPASWNLGKPLSEHKTDTAITAIQLGAPLTITGRATISNSRLVLLQEAHGYSVKSTETLITAQQGLSGRFDTVSYGSNFFWNTTLNYSSTTLSADLTRRTSAQSLAMSLNAPANVIDGAQMADTLIRYTDALVESGQTAGHEALLSATAKLMSAPDDEAAAQSLSSLTGEIHRAARALGIQRAFSGSERLADRLRTLGSGQATGVWLQNAANNAQFSRLGYGTAEVQHSTSGIGADAVFGERWTLGMSAARTASNARLDSVGGRLSGIGQQMAVYARSHWGNRGYFSSLVSFDEHTVDTQRQVLAGDTLSPVSGQHTDTTTLLRLESGLNLRTGFAPYFAAGTLSLRQSGFSESGILGLSADTDTFTAEFAEIGTRFDRHLGRWTLAANTSVRRLFGGDSGFNAAFAGAQAARFTVAGQPLTGTRIRLGSDLSYQALNSWQLTLSLGTEHSNGQKRNGWSEATARIGF